LQTIIGRWENIALHTLCARYYRQALQLRRGPGAV
jgi:hypothetical protein